MRDDYCTHCGAAQTERTKYPRVCPKCNVSVWANPIPVSVVLQPVIHRSRTGLLVVRRSIEPRKDKLALVGGFLEEHETWQTGGAREIFEETGVRVDPNKLDPFWFTSTEPKPNRVLLFSIAAPIAAITFGPFSPSNETNERGLIFGASGLDEHFAFPLHIQAAKRFFESRGNSGAHDYTIV